MKKKTKLRVVDSTTNPAAGKVPSAAIIGLAVGAVVLSLGLKLYSRHKVIGTVVGAWLPSLLLAAYNKFEHSRQPGRKPQLAAHLAKVDQ